MRTWSKLGLVAGAGALACGLWAAPAAADPPTITGTMAVGGTITVSGDQNTSCAGVSASATLSRQLTESTSVGITSASTTLVLGQPWSVQLTVPATDLGGTALQPGDVIIVRAGGICNANGDQFSFTYDDVLLTLGAPVQATTTSTTTTAPPADTTTTTAATQATTAPPAAAPAQELPRTGGASWAVGAAGAGLVAGGLVVAAAARRRASA